MREVGAVRIGHRPAAPVAAGRATRRRRGMVVHQFAPRTAPRCLRQRRPVAEAGSGSVARPSARWLPGRRIAEGGVRFPGTSIVTMWRGVPRIGVVEDDDPEACAQAWGWTGPRAQVEHRQKADGDVDSLVAGGLREETVFVGNIALSIVSLELDVEPEPGQVAGHVDPAAPHVADLGRHQGIHLGSIEEDLEVFGEIFLDGVGGEQVGVPARVEPVTRAPEPPGTAAASACRRSP